MSQKQCLCILHHKFSALELSNHKVRILSLIVLNPFTWEKYTDVRSVIKNNVKWNFDEISNTDIVINTKITYVKFKGKRWRKRRGYIPILPKLSRAVFTSFSPSSTESVNRKEENTLWEWMKVNYNKVLWPCLYMIWQY